MPQKAQTQVMRMEEPAAIQPAIWRLPGRFIVQNTPSRLTGTSWYLLSKDSHD
jgi:hypothetical protein